MSWPSHAEELARKSLETLSAALTAVDEGQMTEAQAAIVANTLCDTIHGLVAPEVFDTIYAVKKELSQ